MKLGEIVNINMGQSPRSEFYNSRGEGMPFYQGVTDFGEKYPKKSTYCSRPTKIAEVGDIFFSVRAPVGDVNVAIEKSCIGRGVAALRMKNGNNDFLYFFLKNYERYFKGISGGTTYESINKDQLEDIEFIIPSDLNEQKRIAFILSAFDDKIELNNKISRTLEQTAQVVFKEWFVNFKFPGHEKVKIVDSELGKIPVGWGVKKFFEIAHLNRGVSYSSKEISAKEGGLPMINLANFLRGGGFNSSGVKHYTGVYKDSHLVKPGQIIIAMTDLTSNREVIGHPARVPEDFSKALISLDVCSINTEDIYVEFLYSLMLRRSFSQLMAGSASGTNVSHLNKTNIEEYLLILPSRDLLPKFNKLIRPMFTQQINLSAENQKLAALRDLLLPKLMSGEIRL